MTAREIGADLTHAIAAMRDRSMRQPWSPDEREAQRDTQVLLDLVEVILKVHTLGTDGWCQTCAPSTRSQIPRRVANFGCLTRAVVAEKLLTGHSDPNG